MTTLSTQASDDQDAFKQFLEPILKRFDEFEKKFEKLDAVEKKLEVATLGISDLVERHDQLANRITNLERVVSDIRIDIQENNNATQRWGSFNESEDMRQLRSLKNNLGQSPLFWER